MKAKKCPLCGEKTLVAKRGDYRMSLPATLAGGEITIADATWLHCDSCGEDILSSDLEREINRQCAEKRVLKVG